MQFTVSTSVLDSHLRHVSRVITSRSAVPVLSNLLLETDKDILRISGTDLELAMTTYLPAEIKQEGTFTVPAKVFQEFVHQNPDDTITFTLESFELVCKSEKVEARISGMEADEYPALPKMEKGTVLRLPFHSLVEACKKVIIACAQDQARPVLTGIQLRLDGDKAVLAATDSFRLVEKQIEIVPVQEVITALLPLRSIQELIRLSSGFPTVEDLEVELTDQQALFRIGSIELFSRLIVGAFPKYQAIIPTKAVTVAGVTTSEFVQALRLSHIFSQSGVANVMLEISAEGNLTVSSYGSQRGSTKHTVYAVVEEGFEPIKVAFNARFLIDACSASGSPHVQLRFSGATSALVIKTDEPDYLQLVMPIRLDS